jgi:hypothetical protein
MTTSGPEGVGATRQALHTLAEHLLAGDLHRNTGRIGLRVTPGGIGQPEHVIDGVRRRLRIDGTSLVVLAGDAETWHPLSTLADAGAAAGTAVAGPVGVYELLTAADPAAPLRIDPVAAMQLGAMYVFGEQALEEIRRQHRTERPAIAQLWPEHLDLACAITEVNLGISPGDDGHAEPYLYVGPWQVPDDPWWTEPWGRALTWTPELDLDRAVAFFEEGLERAAAARR